MSANTKMSVAVHILTLLATDRRGTDKEVATSERVATSVNTNPVVVRRALGGLKQAGLVDGGRGKAGGWTLTRPAESISLLEVYRATGDGPVFALPAQPADAGCVIGHGIHEVLAQTYEKVEEGLFEGLRSITIADVLRESLARLA
ncbi:Rrf2 family transcriptional regulator [Streptomyces bauhiniae]